MPRKPYPTSSPDLKYCSGCKQEKPFDAFGKHKRDGYQSKCKPCLNELSYDWIRRNRERVNERERNKRAANREKYRAKYARERANSAAARRASHKKWRDSNLERERKRCIDWIASNPDYDKARKHRRRALIKGSGGEFTPGEAQDLRGLYLGRCAYCFDASGKELDHVVPVSRGGTSDIDNMVPACKSCNSSKGDKSLLRFLVYRAGV